MRLYVNLVNEEKFILIFVKLILHAFYVNLGIIRPPVKSANKFLVNLK
jgi:hypothetical protein